MRPAALGLRPRGIDASVSPKISTASAISAARDVERRDPAHDLVAGGRRSARAGRRRRRPAISASGSAPSGSRGRAVADELDADHQPGPADVADPVVLGGDPAEPGDELGAARHGVRDAGPRRGSSRGPPGRPRRRPGCRRTSSRARHDPSAPGARGSSTIAESGRPLAIALATHTTSGTIPACSNAHISPGPAVARLDLVGDEQDAVLVAERAQRRAGTTAGAGL